MKKPECEKGFIFDGFPSIFYYYIKNYKYNIFQAIQS
jgi:hypothetical protein